MIEYIEDGHLYINSKGVIIPSVSSLVSFAFPNSYKGVDPYVLKKKAEYGSTLHEILERYDNGEKDIIDEITDENLKQALETYIVLKKEYKINPVSQEEIIDFDERYAGRYDKLDANGILWDVKTTCKKLIEKWECQLGLYYLALGKNKKIANVIWLPKKKKGEVVKIKPWSKKKCLELLEEYEKKKQIENN